MDAESLSLRLTACGIPCEARLAESLAVYHDMLLDWNTRMDLTAVLDEAEMIDRHYADSLSALRFPGFPAEGRVIDVGTGAGFPGLPLALACPSLSFTLLDSLQKRLTFLQAVVDRLALPNVTLVHARAEDGGRDPALRERFDLALSRAVAPLPVLAEYVLPYVKPGGLALCWKGPGLSEELPQGRRAAHLLGGRPEEPWPVDIPGRDWHHVLLPIRKTAGTPRAYPRPAGKAQKAPLG